MRIISALFFITILLASCLFKNQDKPKVNDSKKPDIVSYESMSDSSKVYEIRHYSDSVRLDSLFIYQNNLLIHRFYCKPEDSEMGYFTEKSIINVSDSKLHSSEDLIMNDSVLFIPITMSFNGWIRIFTYDIKSKKEIFLNQNGKNNDLWSKGPAYINQKKNRLFILKGPDADDVIIGAYDMKNTHFKLVKTFRISRKEFSEEQLINLVAEN